MTIPARPHPSIARARFEKDYNELVGNGLFNKFGWICIPDFENLLMHVKMYSREEDDTNLDMYYIKFDFSFYPNYPPRVRFINPNTGEFDPQKDQRWLPARGSKPPGVNFAFHLSYGYGGKLGMDKDQLVCNSMVFEYYITGHNPKPDEKWDKNKHTFFATLRVIDSVLRKPYYNGRWI